MPELPEVQTVVNDLNKKVAGRKITGMWFDWPKMLKDPLDQQKNKIAHKHVEVFQKIIKGQRILGVRRRAKNILMYLGSAEKRGTKTLNNAEYILLTHLKMTGHYLVGKWDVRGEKVKPIEPKEMISDPYNSYIHIIFYLDNGQMLALSDLRKFAKALLGTKEQIENLPELLKLGPEANDPKLSLEKFKEALRQAQGKKIKQVLMDQEVIAGIGNIYSDEILWQSRIHPFRPANKLKDKEIKNMYLAMKSILAKALKLRGTSSSDYRDTSGKKGGYDLVRLAYDREGEPCKRCGAKIDRKKVGGRSAHFCPRCQKL